MLLAATCLVITTLGGHSPWFVVALLVIVAGVHGVSGYRRLLKHRSYLVGSEGERSAGRDFDELRAHGWYVFHDVVVRRGAPWNIDHVLVGPGGVFAIETKNWTKPHDDAKLAWDGRTITVSNKQGEYSPWSKGEGAVRQASRNANDLAEVLRQETAKTFRVHAVVALPNWFVRETGGGSAAVRVVSPRYLVMQLKSWRGEPGRRGLEAADVALVRSRLELMCRRD